MRIAPIVAAVLMALPVCCRGEKMNIPDDFPRFAVPGYEKQMDSLRQLYWLHYPGSGPKSTIWDMWLAPPSLWPAVESGASAENMRKAWSDVLSSRTIDSEGYVSTHQHPSIAHPLGWPFPFWNQGLGGYGWHFSFKDTIGLPWRPQHANTTEGWQISGAADEGIGEYGWAIKINQTRASITTPEQKIDTYQAPFLQLRWKAKGLGNAQPCIEWTTADEPEFGADRRVYFDPVETDTLHHSVITMYKHPRWQGEINRLRICFGNPKPGADVVVQAFFTQYDTRHNVNSQSYIHGCTNYFRWTRDLNFLRRNINRMRNALNYVMTEHEALERNVVYTGWVGHDGRSGLVFDKDGNKHIRYGHGIGNNYWDLLPFGHLDCSATMLYYVALKDMAEIERYVRQYPEWNLPAGVFSFDPDELEKHAAQVKATGNKLFWNSETGRFIPGIDADGKIHDFGLTFLNLEAIYYDFATPEHARTIMSWINGERIVEGDTSTGADIYFWRFGPRATTKRNLDYYIWVWSTPEGIPFGEQVQDGGAVLGFSYHDLMSRLKVFGPDNTWKRVQEITKWFDEVQTAGGYRKYYDGSREGTLQGGGTAGGLGLDSEFFESVLVPQVMIDGFLGFVPGADGFGINPKLPSDWPEFVIDRIYWHDNILRVRAKNDVIEVTKQASSDEPFWLKLPEGNWNLFYITQDGGTLAAGSLEKRKSDGAVRVDWAKMTGIRLERVR